MGQGDSDLATKKKLANRAVVMERTKIVTHRYTVCTNRLYLRGKTWAIRPISRRAKVQAPAAPPKRSLRWKVQKYKVHESGPCVLIRDMDFMHRLFRGLCAQSTNPLFDVPSSPPVQPSLFDPNSCTIDRKRQLEHPIMVLSTAMRRQSMTTSAFLLRSCGK